MINKALFPLLAAIFLFTGTHANANGVGGGGGGDRPMAYASACSRGPSFYQMEEDSAASRPVMRKVLYVCINGIYRRNGFVPRYPRCTEGENRMIKEWKTYGNHEIEVGVRYTCVNGMLKRNP